MFERPEQQGGEIGGKELKEKARNLLGFVLGKETTMIPLAGGQIDMEKLKEMTRGAEGELRTVLEGLHMELPEDPKERLQLYNELGRERAEELRKLSEESKQREEEKLRGYQEERQKDYEGDVARILKEAKKQGLPDDAASRGKKRSGIPINPNDPVPDDILPHVGPGGDIDLGGLGGL